MLLHCYAMIPKTADRDWLTARLRHHNLPFTETSTHVSLDLEVLNYRTVAKIVSYFESVESTERGVTVIGDREEVPYDTG